MNHHRPKQWTGLRICRFQLFSASARAQRNLFRRLFGESHFQWRWRQRCCRRHVASCGRSTNQWPFENVLEIDCVRSEADDIAHHQNRLQTLRSHLDMARQIGHERDECVGHQLRTICGNVTEELCCPVYVSQRATCVPLQFPLRQGERVHWTIVSIASGVQFACHRTEWYGEFAEVLCRIGLWICFSDLQIATIVYSRHKRVKFNPLWLDDIYEKVLIDHTVDEINPLVLNPGRLLLSTQQIYFQPYNNVQPFPVIKISLASIVGLIKRRFLLRQIVSDSKWRAIVASHKPIRFEFPQGLEIRWTENDKERLLYVSFRNHSERDEFYERVVEQERVCIKDTEPESMTLKWQNGVISNYEYLLYLNRWAFEIQPSEWNSFNLLFWFVVVHFQFDRSNIPRFDTVSGLPMGIERLPFGWNRFEWSKVLSRSEETNRRIEWRTFGKIGGAIRRNGRTQVSIDFIVSSSSTQFSLILLIQTTDSCTAHTSQRQA